LNFENQNFKNYFGFWILKFGFLIKFGDETNRRKGTLKMASRLWLVVVKQNQKVTGGYNNSRQFAYAYA